MGRPDDHQRAEDSNRHLWNEIAPVHMTAYEEVRILREGGEILDADELRDVGNVAGKSLLHLQCHIGTDTLAWRRRGAVVTGVDFSPVSIACSRRLAAELGLEARFIEANLYDLPQVLSEPFDIVYTSRGVLCWLRDLKAWGELIARYLSPGGIFYMMEAHPLLNALGETSPGTLSVAHRYFHREQPTAWDDTEGDYADPTYVPSHPSYEWEWSLADVFRALLCAGLRIEHFDEQQRLFFRRYPSMELCAPRWYHLPRHKGKLPLLFTLRARKPTDGG